MTTATIEPSKAAIRREIAEATPGLHRRRPLPDPAEVPDLFRNIGARPEQRENGEFGPDGSLEACCGLTAVLIDRTGHRTAREMADRGCFSYQRRLALELSDDFNGGAQDGFDGVRMDESFARTYPEYAEGHAWGKAAWEACVAAGLTGDPTSVLDGPVEGVALIDDETA